jgi:DNA-binding XRE family transcriptional regulator
MAGRPTKYKKEYCEQAYKLCLLGATDAELADFFNVTESTLNLWKKNHKEFSESLKSGKYIADAEVANKLYHRALGYSHEEDKIFQYEGQPVVVPTIKHYAPDPTSAIFWLKNRQREKWTDSSKVEVTEKHIIVDIEEDDEE